MRAPPARSAPTALDAAAWGVTALATLWFVIAACWEIDAPFGAGHYAASTAVATAGENMFRWGIFAPVPFVTASAPGPQDVYCHHPWGIFWVSALFVRVLGHHAWVCRLPAVLASAATPPVLYALGRALWSRVAGAVAACGFVVLPIALAFASFNSLEVPTILGLLLFALGLVRLRANATRGAWTLTLGSLVFALDADWPAFVFAALCLGVLLVRAAAGRGDQTHRRHDLRVALAIAAVCLAVGGFYLLAFHHTGQLAALRTVASLRAVGARTSLVSVLASRRQWLELSFTPFAIALGALAIPVVAVRAMRRRGRDEWIPLAFFGAATFQYFVFKEAADLHVFWPQYFAAYFALALGALAATLEEIAPWILPRVGDMGRGGLTLALFAGFAALVLPDGVRGLRFAHATGGRFNERGLRITSDLDKTAALAFVATRMPTPDPLVVDHTMHRTYFFDWVLQRPVQHGSAPLHGATPAERYFLTDARFASAWVLAGLAQRYAVEAIGPYWFVDSARPAAPIAGFTVYPWTPTGLTGYLTAGSHPRYRVEPDPFATWDLRARMHQAPNPRPTAVPRTLEAMAIAHNAALAEGEMTDAALLLQRLVGALDPSPACTEPSGARLLGVRLEPGVSDVLSVYFLAAEPLSPLAQFAITGTELRGPPASWLRADPTPRIVGMPFTTPPSQWRAGFVYVTTMEVLARPGTEQLVGEWTGRPAASSGACAPARTLVTLAGG